ncbi:hypothetical protein KHQ81_00010 [Mycoplasmatota bacterium]|nr:hypothetical protein KHQ81_00010 [Mycoplasmatota bacterium]
MVNFFRARKIKNELPSIENSKKFLKDMLIFLGSEYDVQCSMIEEFALWNLSDDIASEWYWDYFSIFVNVLLEDNIITDKIADEFKTIADEFDLRSRGGDLFDEYIWTHEGLKNHVFWSEQRQRAMALYKYMDKL